VALSYYHISPDSISRSGKQSESLIYLSKLLKKRHCNNLQIVANTEKQGRKTYKSLMINRNINLVFKNFVFFKDSHQKSSVIFFIYMIYNFLIGKGFDKIKP
jgi:hypothetical protein